MSVVLLYIYIFFFCFLMFELMQISEAMEADGVHPKYAEDEHWVPWPVPNLGEVQ